MKVTLIDNPKEDSTIIVDGVNITQEKARKKSATIKKIISKWDDEEILECLLIRYGKVNLKEFKYEIEI